MLNNGEVIPVNKKATVPGGVLNQFAMDEYDGYLRMATTWYYKSDVCSNVYCIDINTMQVVGKIEGIAPTERIYSARFTEETGYIVTFRQVDPLFSIDLSDPENPKIKGELKIPGFSTYLHPWKNGLMIGIGQDVEANDEIARTSGLKLSLFDVTDINNPKEIKKLVLSSGYGYSNAEYDHKAVMVNPEKGLIGIPAYTYDQNHNQTFNGYMVFSVSTEKGFEKVCTVEHKDSQNILRGLMIGDNLYTMSPLYLVATTLSGDAISTVEIGSYNYYWKDGYRVDGGIAEPAAVPPVAPGN